MRISLEKIGAHLRQDETYEDGLLEGYLMTSLRIAEEFLGEPLISRQRIGGTVTVNRKGEFTLKHEVDSVEVTDAYGRTIEVSRVGRRKFRIQRDPCYYYIPAETEFHVEYEAGPRSPDEPLDPIIEQGVLRLIAYMYENRGDEANTSGQVGVNTIVQSSGALELFSLTRGVVF